MPILAPEPSVYPATLFATLDHGGERQYVSDQSRWWTLHTRPRAEKALARRLLRKELSFFLPVHSASRNERGRLQARLPLFPGYLFLRGPHEACSSALDTGLIANCLEVVDQETLSSNLRDLYRLIEAGGPISRTPNPSPGTKVRIIKGPLLGLEGIVSRSGSSLKFIVEVQFLQSGAAVEVDGSMIERA